MDEKSTDVLLVPGPRALHFPSSFVSSFLAILSESDLQVQMMDHKKFHSWGVLPSQGTGGVLISHDEKGKILRTKARSIIKFLEPSSYISPRTSPDPFLGWGSKHIFPLDVAKKMLTYPRVSWGPRVILLGSGNHAFHLGREILKKKQGEVLCLDHRTWGNKNYSGWEVEKRAFEQEGGIFQSSKIHQIISKEQKVYAILEDESGNKKELEISKVISVGPYYGLPDLREYPEGSLLYEVDLEAVGSREEDPEGWLRDEERGKYLAVKIIKSLQMDLSKKKDFFDSSYKKAKLKIKNLNQHQIQPHDWEYEGKWLSKKSSHFLKSSDLSPREAHQVRLVPSIECYESISCHRCEQICPERAIQKTSDHPRLLEGDCTSCGLCVAVCPTSSVTMIQENPSGMGRITFSRTVDEKIREKKFVELLNRKSESLGQGRVLKVWGSLKSGFLSPQTVLVDVEVPVHLLWDVRSIRPLRSENELEEDQFKVYVEDEKKIEKRISITLQGAKRLVPESIPLTEVLMESGLSRSQDVLSCETGACGQCMIQVDGERILGCQKKTKVGMDVEILEQDQDPKIQDLYLCHCEKIRLDEFLDKLNSGKIQSPITLQEISRVGQGQCHGQKCLGTFRRILLEYGMSADQWIDWSFPWKDQRVESSTF